MKKIIPLIVAAGLLVSLTACGTTVSDQISNCTSKTMWNNYHTNPDLYTMTPSEKDAYQQKIMDKCQAEQKNNPAGFAYNWGS